MYTFSENVPADPKGRVFDLVRVKQQSSVKAVVTSDRSLSIPTHYWGGRTMPHPDHDCPACQEGMAYRWHTYVACFSLKRKLHVIFESTSTAAKPFDLYFRAYGTLRGCEFTAHRLGTRVNSRVLIETKPANLELESIPNEPALMKCLCRIWNVPFADAEIARPNSAEPILNVDRVDATQQISRPRIHNPATKDNGEKVPV